MQEPGRFLNHQRRVDPDHFKTSPSPSLSCSGEEYVEIAGPSPGHLVWRCNTIHIPRPNRRYPDLLTQRLLKGALAKAQFMGSGNLRARRALYAKENDANKVERFVKMHCRDGDGVSH
jgi:hypothetical protein